MSRGTTHRTVRVEDELWLPAKAKAEAEGRNLSDVIREGLRAYVEYADRVDRITNDPRRIEKRKRIAPAVEVPRRRPGGTPPSEP